MRLGIFGGTFDPPHHGHLLAASDAFEALTLDRMLFVPANVQPLKDGLTTTPAAQRLEMVRRLIAGDRRFSIDTLELERPGVSFTIDTLRTLAEREPGATRFLVVGADVLESFHLWREPMEIIRHAVLAVVRRPGEWDTAALAAALQQVRSAAGPQAVVEIPGRLVDISSTEIRARVRRGLPITGFVPAAVAEFVAAERLYH